MTRGQRKGPASGVRMRTWSLRRSPVRLAGAGAQRFGFERCAWLPRRRSAGPRPAPRRAETPATWGNPARIGSGLASRRRWPERGGAGCRQRQPRRCGPGGGRSWVASPCRGDCTPCPGGGAAPRVGGRVGFGWGGGSWLSYRRCPQDLCARCGGPYHAAGRRLLLQGHP